MSFYKNQKKNDKKRKDYKSLKKKDNKNWKKNEKKKLRWKKEKKKDK